MELFLALALAQLQPGFPIYSAASITNAATNESGSYAPNGLISIYGVNLSTGTYAIGASSVQGGNLPTSLGGVRVLLNGSAANVYYASPHQINALVPTNFTPGQVMLSVVSNGRAGPAIRVELGESSPGLFEAADHFVVATHGNGALITEADPARAGEIVVIYATGLGPTVPQTPVNRIPNAAAPLKQVARFEVWIDGAPVGSERILYVGVTPGYGGLFQINLRLPDGVAPNPEIRVGVPEAMSPPGRFLRVR